MPKSEYCKNIGCKIRSKHAHYTAYLDKNDNMVELWRNDKI